MIILMVCKGKLEGKYEIQSTLKDYMKQQETVFLKYAFTIVSKIIREGRLFLITTRMCMLVQLIVEILVMQMSYSSGGTNVQLHSS